MRHRAGTHPKIIQERLGHSSIAATLDIYSHTVPGLRKVDEDENGGKMMAKGSRSDIGRAGLEPATP